MTTPARKTFSWTRLPPADRRPALRLSAGSRKWDVRMVGMISRARFMVTHPTDDGKLVFVKEGERLDVATFDGAVINAFESTVLRVSFGDAPSLELALPPPDQRRRETVRKTRRASIVMPCSLRYGVEADALRAGFTGDLSYQGAQVAIERPLPAGIDRIDLSLRLAALGAPVTVTVPARVRSSAPDPRPNVSATLLGLEFIDVPAATQMTLAEFVGERLLADADDVFGAIR